jgi:hypothetical protein
MGKGYEAYGLTKPDSGREHVILHVNPATSILLTDL